MKSSNIGGQAVLEGIMMKHREDYAVAVRKPDGEIFVQKDTYPGIIPWKPLTTIPFVRGIFNFIDSMVLGIRTLTFSASFYEEEEEKEEAPLTHEEAARRERREKWLMRGTVAFSVVVAVAIFMVLPYLLSSLLGRWVSSYHVRTVIEGFVRIGIFVAYVMLISRMEDIQRTFMYHGAEHKTIACYEAEDPLTPENAMKHSRLHPRCGTSFLILVILVSIVLYAVLPWSGTMLRVLYKLAMLPLLVGICYEILKWAGRSNSLLARAVSVPGLWLQHLTTFEPEDDMIEVAIAAVTPVLPKKPEDGQW